MKPNKHVQKNPDTGKFCVYNLKGKKVAEFDSEDKAVAYATKNHDSLMKEDAPTNATGTAVDMTPGKKKTLLGDRKPLKRFKDFEKE